MAFLGVAPNATTIVISKPTNHPYEAATASPGTGPPVVTSQTGTVKRKLTTFCTPEAQIMESPLMHKRSPPNMDSNSTGVSNEVGNTTSSILLQRNDQL